MEEVVARASGDRAPAFHGAERGSDRGAGNGRIGEIGSHAELMARGGHHASVVETQRKGFLGRPYSSSKAVNGGTLVIQKPARPPCWSTST